jgi:ATP-binding cassette, subfamily B, bacterial
MRAATPLPEGTSTQPRAGAWRTLVRGISLSPELRVGLPGTLVLALVATAGRAIVPIAIQRVIDDGLGVAGGGVDLGVIAQVVAFAGLAVLLTALASGWMNYRLATVVETALSSLRVRAFRHIHDLSMLHQATQQRGSLVSRVTSDVDEISRFMQWAGLNLITATGQLTVAPIGMFVY